MDATLFTLKSQAMISQAQQDALAQDHPSIDASHLLNALLIGDNPMVPSPLQRMGVPVDALGATNKNATRGLACSRRHLAKMVP